MDMSDVNIVFSNFSVFILPIFNIYKQMVDEFFSHTKLVYEIALILTVCGVYARVPWAQ